MEQQSHQQPALFPDELLCCRHRRNSDCRVSKYIQHMNYLYLLVNASFNLCIDYIISEACINGAASSAIARYPPFNAPLFQFRTLKIGLKIVNQKNAVLLSTRHVKYVLFVCGMCLTWTHPDVCVCTVVLMSTSRWPFVFQLSGIGESLSVWLTKRIRKYYVEEQTGFIQGRHISNNILD